MNTMTSLRGATFCIALLTPSFAGATLPLITDDAGTVGKGHFQLEVNAQYDHDQEHRVTTTGGQVDPIFTYGIADSIDLVLITPYLWINEKSNLGKSSEKGLSDATVDVKFRVFEKDGLSFAVKPGLSLPTGDDDKGLGTGKLGYHIYFIGTKETGPWSFSANLGYIRNETNVDTDERDIWHASVSTIYTINDRWKIAADLVAERNTSKDNDNDPVYALGGVIFSLTKDIDLDLGLKAGLTSSATDWSLLAGATFRF
jgi:hypothetical protein